MADHANRNLDQHAALEAELRALSLRLMVPRAGDVTAPVRQRLEARHAAGLRRILGTGLPRRGPLHRRPLYRQPRWRIALIAVGALLLLVVATPQGRAAISHVFRFDGIELRQAPGPSPAPATSASLPGERRVSLSQARHQVGFPVLAPTSLGQPSEVMVSDGGRVVSLIYGRTVFGEVRLDEFDGHLDAVAFRKFVLFSNVTEVRVNGVKGLWITGPQELLYIRRDGTVAAASAELTTGNTLIWGTARVAVRMAGGFGKAAALAIADSTR